MLAKRRTNRAFAIPQHFKCNSPSAADPVPAYPAVGLRGGRSGLKAWTVSAVQPFPPLFKLALRTVPPQAGLRAFSLKPVKPAQGPQGCRRTVASLCSRHFMANVSPNAGRSRQNNTALQDAFQFQALARALAWLAGSIQDTPLDARRSGEFGGPTAKPSKQQSSRSYRRAE